MRIAIITDYLVHIRGGERVVRSLSEIYPDADLYCLVSKPSVVRALVGDRRVGHSFIQRLPFSQRYFRAFLPLYPIAASRMKLPGYDLVIAVSSAWAHGVARSPGSRLICYCLSPFRYIWSHYDSLVAHQLGVGALAIRSLRSRFQSWDIEAARGVDTYIAISETTRSRIRRFYGRESAVVWPPVDLDAYRVASGKLGDYFLIVSALVPYKRIDIAVEAFTRTGLPLIIVGRGPQERYLQGIAGPSVRFVGELPDAEVAELYRRCRAFVFTAAEDFGIAPLEAMASGRPVIAFKAGGALETVKDGVTGRFFVEQTADSLIDAVTGDGLDEFMPDTIRHHAEGFSVAAFQRRFTAEVARAVGDVTGKPNDNVAAVRSA